jgi:hypothetical protein
MTSGRRRGGLKMVGNDLFTPAKVALNHFLSNQNRMCRPTRRQFWAMQFSCESHFSLCDIFSATQCEKRKRGANLTVGEIFLTPSETKKGT